MATDSFTQKLMNVIVKVAYDMEREAKRLCPVDTGRLRASISVRIDGNTITLSAGTDYAEYVEFGTYKMDAQPFIRPAIHKAIRTIIPRRVKEEFG